MYDSITYNYLLSFGGSPKDVSYVFSGYAPLSIRLIQHAIRSGWSVSFHFSNVWLLGWQGYFSLLHVQEIHNRVPIPFCPTFLDRTKNDMSFFVSHTRSNPHQTQYSHFLQYYHVIKLSPIHIKHSTASFYSTILSVMSYVATFYRLSCHVLSVQSTSNTVLSCHVMSCRTALYRLLLYCYCFFFKAIWYMNVYYILYNYIWSFRRPLEEILKLLPGTHTESKRVTICFLSLWFIFSHFFFV